MGIAERVGRGLLGLHQAVYQASDGRVGHSLLGLPCLLLRTQGRRSGRPRTAALVYGQADGEHGASEDYIASQDYIVVASTGGSNQAPGWLHNLRDRPEVDVQVGRHRFPAMATVVEQGDPDHARLWRLMNDLNNGRYDRYQARTTRPIPIVRLAAAPA